MLSYLDNNRVEILTPEVLPLAISPTHLHFRSYVARSKRSPPSAQPGLGHLTLGLIMDASHLTELIELEDTYWWHVAKRQLVVDLLARYFPQPGRLVEGGIGSARNLIEFRKLGYDVAGLDIMPESVEHAHSRGLANCQLHDLTQPWPFDAETTQVVVLLDVLEHLSDPVGTLEHIHHILQPGGGVILTVPAHPWMYGDWDKSLGHYRRYHRQELEDHCRTAGFHIERLSFWNGFTFPAAVAVRGKERLTGRTNSAEFPRVGRMVNSGLQMMASAERWWLKRFPAPCGLSYFAVLRK
ncbi:MAG: class I SAM-dependent methyltransferase [Planctomycetaceae bacterium]